MNEKVKDIIKTILTYFFIILAVIIIRVFFVSPVKVDGKSMDTTLQNGEVLLLNKIVYKKSDIKRFDIVVIEDKDKFIIKRVIGLPGETVEYKNNELYINGEKVDDPYPSTTTDDFSITDNGFEKIPGDYYFVLGDNRSVSKDSRFTDVGDKSGLISKKQIVGRARLIIWPFNKIGSVK